MEKISFTSLFVGLMLASGLMSSNALAGDSAHILGGSLGYGTQEFETKNGKYDAGDTLTSDLYYRYMLNEHLTVNMMRVTP